MPIQTVATRPRSPDASDAAALTRAHLRPACTSEHESDSVAGNRCGHARCDALELSGRSARLATSRHAEILGQAPASPVRSRSSRGPSSARSRSRPAATGSRSGAGSGATRSRSAAASRSSSCSSPRSSARRSQRTSSVTARTTISTRRDDRSARRSVRGSHVSNGRPAGDHLPAPRRRQHARPRRVPAPALRRAQSRSRSRCSRRSARSRSACCSARWPATSAAGSTRSSRA